MRYTHCFALALAGVALILGSCCAPAAADEIILDEDTAPLFPDVGRRLTTPPDTSGAVRPDSAHVDEPGAFVLATPPRRSDQPVRYEVVEVKVKQIFNIRGNNPLNQIDPLKNYNGQTFPTVDELIAVLQRQTVQPGPDFGQGCSGNSVRLGHQPIPIGTQTIDFYFATLELDPRSGKCRMFDNSDGMALLVQTPTGGEVGVPGNMPGDRFEIASQYSSDWRIIDANAEIVYTTGNRIYHFPPNVPLTLRLQSQSTGVLVQIDLAVRAVGTGDYTLEIYSIEKIVPKKGPTK